MGDLEHALSAYENALRHNALSVSGLTQVAGIARIKENYAKVSNLSILPFWWNDVIAPTPFIGCWLFPTCSQHRGGQRRNMECPGYVFQSIHILIFLIYKMPIPRSLLSHARWPPEGILRIPASTLSLTKSQGMSYCVFLTSPLINTFAGRSQTLVWYWYPLRSIWFPRPRRRGLLVGSSYV